MGGLEHDTVTGNVSYAPMNHEQMIRTRGRKIAGITREIPKTEVFGADRGDLLVLGWGGTFGALREATRQLNGQGKSVGHVHLRYLNPLPADLPDVMARFRRVLVPEINLGQLVKLIRAEYLVDAIGMNQVQGRPFKVGEVVGRCLKLLNGAREEAA